MHSPGHLREAFGEWVEDGMRDELVGEDIFYEGPRPIRWLLGQLWHCSDIMPWNLCDDLGVPRGSTYGASVQAISGKRASLHD
jgi:hypothetical protein